MSALPEVAQINLSPCIRVCRLDAQNVCAGCGRTLDEIARWSRLSLDEQRAICAIAAQRRQARVASNVSG
ncbi:MAG TPA: DUF1289 domain-containing protein [Steroidobacteraceae bacterium]|nr:DUF1289 domain-containing protein [Steroidobacteraceae bacterium]